MIVSFSKKPEFYLIIRKDAMDKLKLLIGKLTLAFTDADFLVSDIVYKMGITGERFAFFADTKTGHKIENLRNFLQKSDGGPEKAFLPLIERLDELRQERNKLVHSIILKSSTGEDFYIRHRYVLNKEKRVMRDQATFDLKEYEETLQELLGLCKEMTEYYWGLIPTKIKNGARVIRKGEATT